MRTESIEGLATHPARRRCVQVAPELLRVDADAIGHDQLVAPGTVGSRKGSNLCELGRPQNDPLGQGESASQLLVMTRRAHQHRNRHSGQTKLDRLLRRKQVVTFFSATRFDSNDPSRRNSQT